MRKPTPAKHKTRRRPEKKGMEKSVTQS